MDEQENSREFYPLTDEEGNTTLFELIAETEYKGKKYYAFIPADEAAQESEEEGVYVILRAEPQEDGTEDWVTLEDDEEFDDVADIFDAMFSEEIDYDDPAEEKKP